MSDTLARLAANIDAALLDLPAGEARLAKAAAAILRGDIEGCICVCDAIRIERLYASLHPALRQLVTDNEGKKDGPDN